MPINASGFYEAVLQGRYRNQNVFNILHYRIGADIIPGQFNFAGAPELAAALKQVVWEDGLKGIALTEYLLDKIVVYPRNPDFSTIYQNPYVLEVGEYGVRAGSPSGAAPCAIVRFNLEPTSILNDFHPPRSGYVAFGPVAENTIDPDGNIEAGDYSTMNTVFQCLADDIPSGLLGLTTFYPIRVSTVKVGGLLTLRGWADVSSCTLRHKASFRRSRVGEA